MTTISYAQETIDIKYGNVDDTINVYECKYDSLYRVSLIPENILDLSYDFIVIGSAIDTTKASKVKEYEIDWPSLYIDGRFYIAVTPRQIYLRTGHENPNPDFLLWVKNINLEIFNKITLELKDNSKFKNYEGTCGAGCTILSYEKYKAELEIPDEWTESENIKHENDYYKTLYKNFTSVIDIFNNKLSYSERLIYPDFVTFKTQKNVHIIYGLFELDNYPQNKKLKID
jgi:hypothetical protein